MLWFHVSTNLNTFPKGISFQQRRAVTRATFGEALDPLNVC
ncbi:hypothetical protein LINGRAHAP2_LOCUS604 [Linum grandiflorum]